MRVHRPIRFFRAALIFAMAFLLGACNNEVERAAKELTGGDPQIGKRHIQFHGCGGCHYIPGIPGADGPVGPPLDGIAARQYLAGMLPNNPESMAAWVRNAPSFNSQTVMPEMEITQEEARHIAAYLYTLR
jgi:cytochrome c